MDLPQSLARMGVTASTRRRAQVRTVAEPCPPPVNSSSKEGPDFLEPVVTDVWVRFMAFVLRAS